VDAVPEVASQSLWPIKRQEWSSGVQYGTKAKDYRGNQVILCEPSVEALLVEMRRRRVAHYNLIEIRDRWAIDRGVKETIGYVPYIYTYPTACNS
jgi:hypothetical protein